MEEGTQDKVNTLIARHIDKVSDLSRSQSKVILNHDDRIKDDQLKGGRPNFKRA